ncbi:MAG: DNA repair exonuclease [Chloroflexi bacterium]|nr:MAG: DNA repair exonuclease [Chloroflexota bacterium]
MPQVVRILHFADLHLDRSFAGLSVAPSEAAKRREELRAALRRIVDLALELDVDALTVGGDLYEHERAGPDTGNFIASEFARLAPKRVLVAPGNHDPYVPDSLYWRLEWPPNVHIFQTMSWEPVELSDTLTLWGAGHRGPAVRDNLLATLNVEAGRPFTREDIERSSVDFALLGHYHELRLRPQDAPRYAYPGSPEPLDFSETGDHYVLLLTANGQGLSCEPRKINEVVYQTSAIDITGMSTSDAIRKAICALAEDEAAARAIMRVTLTGQPESDLDLDLNALLQSTHDRFRYLDPIIDKTDTPFDLEQIAEESTTRGAFARMLRQEMADSPPADLPVLQNALHYGLRAFAGQEIRRR